MSLMGGQAVLTRLASGLAAIALSIAGCASEPAGEDSSDLPVTVVTPAPPAPPAAAPPTVTSASRVGALDLSGVRIEEGWDPYPVFADGFNPWFDGAAVPVIRWADRLLPARPAPEGAVRVTVTVALQREPADCFAFHRSVTSVRVGIPGAAGDAIAATLLAAAQEFSDELDRFASESEVDDEEWCQQRFGGELVGFHVVEVHAEACEVPEGPRLVCATVGRLGYHLGAREFWHAETFVFDANTGERLGVDDLQPALEPDVLRELFDRIASEVDAPHLTWYSSPLELDLTRSHVLPSAEGLRWRWAPVSHLVGGVDVLVPWAVLEALGEP